MNIFGEPIHTGSQAPTLTNLQLTIEELADKYKESKKKYAKEWYITANPHITVTIGRSLDYGEGFQESAKVTSSVETKWGNWIEKTIEKFNKNIFYIRAGGIDVILGNRAYDVKSGPQVMNLDQTKQARKKREIIRDLKGDKSLSRLIRINDFKVAIMYGNKDLQSNIMEGVEEIIIYPPDSWAELTGDEWNSFKLYLAAIMYKIKQENAEWDVESLERAVNYYIHSYYSGSEEKLKEALNKSYYKEVKKLVE